MARCCAVRPTWWRRRRDLAEIARAADSRSWTGAPGRGGRSSGRWSSSAPGSVSPARWPTACWPTWSPGSPRAWTWCSSTPACTSRRPCGSATRSPRRMPVTVLSIRPLQTVGQQDGEHGPRLFDRDPGRLLRAAQGGAAGAGTGRTTTPGPPACAGTRRRPGPNTPEVDFDAGRGKVKVDPLARLDRRRRGRPTSSATTCRSTSCSARATARSAAGRAPAGPSRARTRGPGRWAMFDKTECGLHL